MKFVGCAIFSFTTDSKPGSSAPVVTKGPEVVHSTDTSATIAWETDKPADTIVRFGLGSSVSDAVSNGARTTKHQATITGLTPAATYSLAFASTDLEGNTVTGPVGAPVTQLAAFFVVSDVVSDIASSFTAITGMMTKTTPDTTAPVTTSGPTVVAVTNNKAIVRWSTDEIADSRVAYGSSGLTLFNGDIFQTKEHTVILTNLQPGTPYSYQVSSVDPSGNGPTSSAVLAFTTAGAADTTAPDISGLTITGIGDTQATVQWTTNEPATSQLAYGTSAGALTLQKGAEGLRTSHSITITNLLAGTGYTVQPTSTDVSGNQASGTTASFTTTGVTALPVLQVTISGTGSGNVTSVPSGFTCASGSCTAEVETDSVVRLIATPGAISTFGGWSGDCTSSSGDCELTMNVDKSVSVAFNLAPKVRISRTGMGFSTVQEAHTNAQSGDALLLLEDILNSNFVVTKSLQIKGGYNR